MRSNRLVVILSCLLVLVPAVAARAEFAGVSGFQTRDPVNDIVLVDGDPANIARSLANGFPLWIQDAAGNKLAPGLDFGAIVPVPANLIDPGERLTLGGVNAFKVAEALNLNPTRPVVFNGGQGLQNFPELFPYFSLVAEQIGDFNGNGVQDGLILVDHSVLGSFIFEFPVDGDQFMLATTFVRLRNLPAVTGYTLSTPYGSYTFGVAGPDVRIDQSIPVVVLAPPALPPAGDFLSVLAPPGPAIAIRDVALTPGAGVNINAFFAWRQQEVTAYDAAFQAAFPLAGAPPTPGVEAGVADQIFKPILDTLGTEISRQLYLAIPQIVPDLPPANFVAAAEQAVFNGANTQQTVTLTAPVAIDPNNIDGNGNPNDIVITRFSLQGKVFNEGQNVEPTALADAGNAAGGTSSLIINTDGTPLDVTLNDTDPVGNNNVHGIHPQAVMAIPFDEAKIAAAISFADLPKAANGSGNLALVAEVATEQGGTVRRVIDTVTARTNFLYTPPPDPAPGQLFSGTDRFLYVVQDTGGLLSAAAVATINVEAMTMSAEYRAKTGRWRIRGTSSAQSAPDPLNPGQTLANTISIFNGASIPAGATPMAKATVQTDGTWQFEGKLPVSPDGTISCRSANGVPLPNIVIKLK